MKNATKKLILIIFSIVMLIGMAVPALAVEEADDAPAEPVGIVAQGKAGEKIDWTLDENGVLYLDGEGEMYSYDEYTSSPWYEYRDDVTSAVIGDGITTIGSWAFKDCQSMTEAVIPDSVKTIEEYAFCWCYSLEFVSIPESVTTIEDCAFCSCDGTMLFKGDAPTIGPDAFPSVQFAFYSLERDGWTDELFASIDVSAEWRAYSEKNQYFDSGKCGEDATWTLTFDGVLTISGTGDMNTDYGSAWYYCRDLVVSAIIEDGISSIDNYAFENCQRMKNISIPNSVTAIYDYAFCYCTALTSVTIPANVDYIGNGVFYHCLNIADITVDKKNEYYLTDEYGVLYTADYTGLVSAPKKLSGEYVVNEATAEICDYAFMGCSELTEIILPEGLIHIGYYAFLESGLHALTLPSTVEWIDCSFGRCESLETITFLGSAPYINDSAFELVTATVYFPEDDPSWTEDMIRGYGGTLTWPAYSDEPVGQANRAVFSMDDDICANPGDIIDINVYISKNQGIAAGRIEMSGSDFTILDIKPGDWTEAGNYSTNPDNGQLKWYNDVEETNEGVFAVYTVQISEDIDDNSYYIINLRADELTGIAVNDDGEEIVVEYDHGKYAPYQEYFSWFHVDDFHSTVLGDFNDDQRVDNVDIVILARWLVDLVEPGSDYDRMVLRNGDFNNDNSIDNADLVALARYKVTARN